MTNDLHFDINIDYFEEDKSGFITPLTFLRDPEVKRLLALSKFEDFYNYIYSVDSTLVGQMTTLLYNADIDPLDHMSYIPKAFMNFINLPKSTIIIPNNIKRIYDNAFSGSNISSISIPSNIWLIGDSAFSFCSNLKQVTIAKGVSFIEDSVFYDCLELKSINYEGTKQDWKTIDKRSKWSNYSGIKIIHCSDGDIDIARLY